jgi:hypothetical protein
MGVPLSIVTPQSFFLLQCWSHHVNSGLYSRFNGDSQSFFSIQYWLQQVQRAASNVTSIQSG